MVPPIQYCLVGMLFLISAVTATISFMGRTHSKLDILIVIFSAISFFIACDQFRRAFATWWATKEKLEAVESNV